jgi:hypothetical protein
MSLESQEIGVPKITEFTLFRVYNIFEKNERSFLSMKIKNVPTSYNLLYTSNN